MDYHFSPNSPDDATDILRDLAAKAADIREQYSAEPERIIPQNQVTKSLDILATLEGITSRYDILFRRRRDGRREVVVRNYFGNDPLIIPADDMAQVIAEIDRLLTQNWPGSIDEDGVIEDVTPADWLDTGRDTLPPTLS